ISEKSLDKREDVVPGRFSTTTFASPFIPENLCIVHPSRLSPAEFANTIIPTDLIPKALTDRTNTPAINTAAFRKLDGNILAGINVEAAKKVGDKAAGHNGKRTENGFDASDPAPKDSAVEDSYAEGEDKKDKRAIEKRALDVSPNLSKGHPIHTLYGGDRPNNYNGKRAEERGFDHTPNGHPKEDVFDQERKDRRSDEDDNSRGISSSDLNVADMNPLDIRSNTLPPHKCGSAMCLLHRAFDSLISKRDAQPDHPPPQSTNPHHITKPKPKHPSAPKPKSKPKPKPADTYECGGAVVCKLKRALRVG
ncbi:MAG: hypothetical protein Q9180_009233, partial [Flavoplaca navasiana]